MILVCPKGQRMIYLNKHFFLHIVALHGRLEAVQFLLNNCNYPPDATDSCGSTPLMDALRAGFVDVAHLLIQHHKVKQLKFLNCFFHLDGTREQH